MNPAGFARNLTLSSGVNESDKSRIAGMKMRMRVKMRMRMGFFGERLRPQQEYTGRQASPAMRRNSADP
jgi:hypothetical protein